MQYIDHLGITANMSPQEQFQFFQEKGLIPIDAKFEDWTFKDCTKENVKNANRKQKSIL